MDNGKGVYEVDVDTRLSRMKPIDARWVIDLYGKLRNSEKMIENGFKPAAITEAFPLDGTHLVTVRGLIH